MTKKNPQKDGYFSNSDENFELNPDMLEKVAGGRERHFTEDPKTGQVWQGRRSEKKKISGEGS